MPPDDAIGVTDPYQAELFNDAGTLARIHESEIRAMAYLAGGAPDLYDFRTNTLRPDPDRGHDSCGWCSPSPPPGFFDFDRFGSFARDTHSNALVHVNYGTGTPDEAAAWVRSANITHDYGIRNWEIGEESYLNGSAGPGFWAWPDAHKNPDGTPEGPDSWAHNAVSFITAMRQADPTIRIGIPIAMVYPPAAGAHAQEFNRFAVPWNKQVLAVLGPLIDFVDLHWYPQPRETEDAALLASPRSIGDLDRTLRQQLAASGSHADIVIGETNSSFIAFGKQSVGIVNALFLADDMLTWLEQGADGVDWSLWQGDPTPDFDHPHLYGDANFGTIALLSIGACVPAPAHGRVCEPARNTPFVPYYPLKLLSRLIGPGTRLLAGRSDQPAVIAHALALPDGRVTVVLINTDRTAVHRVHVDVPGVRSAGDATIVSFADHDDDLRTRQSGFAGAVELAPYSIAAITTTRPQR